MKITLTETKRKVLVQALEAVGWSALPEGHPERKAAEDLLDEFWEKVQRRAVR